MTQVARTLIRLFILLCLGPQLALLLAVIVEDVATQSPPVPSQENQDGASSHLGLGLVLGVALVVVVVGGVGQVVAWHRDRRPDGRYREALERRCRTLPRELDLDVAAFPELVVPDDEDPSL